MDILITSRASEKEFSAAMEAILTEPEDCHYRVRLFEHFINRYYDQVPDEFTRLVKYKYVMDFLDKTEKYEYAAILRLAMLRNRRTSEYEDKFLKSHIGKSIATLGVEAIQKRFYTEDVERFLLFKKQNGNKAYKVLGEKRINMLKDLARVLF